MNAAAIHAKFFPPARPVCRYTRADLERMHMERLVAKHDRAVRSYIDTSTAGPIHLSAPTRDCKILLVAAIMYGVSVRDLVGPKRHNILTNARAYAAHRLHDIGRTSTQIGEILQRDHTSILNLLRPKTGKRRRCKLLVGNFGGVPHSPADAGSVLP